MSCIPKRGKLAASECGIDYLIPYIDWAEGATTLVRWAESVHPQQVLENTDINSTPVAKPKNPLVEISKLPPTSDAPLTVSISTRFRIPFYSLCHHDEVVQTWRWEDGMNDPLAYWQLKNLWTVLSASAPMYRIYGDKVKKHAEEIRRTQQYVNKWVRQVAFDEMTNHRFVTPDRLVQETEFSSGRGVVVNFGTAAHTLADGQVVKPRDYVMFTKAPDGRRTYTLPPCPNVFAE
ncbi:MAG: glycoside hydrolase [Planctomycetota bacterium]